MAAPIAHLDDEWENFTSFSTSDDVWQKNCFESDHDANANHCKEVNATENNSNGYDNVSATDSNDNLEKLQFSDLVTYESMEDLVHSFDEKVASCFRITAKDTDNNFPNLPVVTLDSYSNDPTWKRLTENYGLVQPLNWNTSHVQKLHLPALSLPFVSKRNDENEQAFCKLYQNDNNDSPDQMDFHHMIEYNVYSENNVIFDPEVQYEGTKENTLMQTADEVIEELEEIMKVAEDYNAALDYEVQEETGIVFNESLTAEHLNEEFQKPITCRQSLGSVSSLEEAARASDLKSKTLTELNTKNEELETQVCSLSTELLEELNKRDEFQYEIELKHSFISKVLEIQYKRDKIAKFTSTSKKFSSLRKGAATEVVAGQGKYLTTVIPSNKGHVLTTDNLQSLIKILDAMKADSDEVPSLLTSYILQVVCPAPSGSHVLKL